MPGNELGRRDRPGSTLLEAVAELREEIHRLVDDQKAVWLTRDPESPPTDEHTSGTDPETPRPHGMTPARDVAPSSKESSSLTDGAGTSRQRLDALAKLLDKRRKPAAPPASDGGTSSPRVGPGGRTPRE